MGMQANPPIQRTALRAAVDRHLVGQMHPSQLEVEGEWPALGGASCDRLIVEEYCHAGELCDAANVVWLRVGASWYRLTIDCGIVIWRRSDEGPAGYLMPELEAEARLRDLGNELGLDGKALDDVVGAATPEAVEVCFSFRGGPQLTFRQVADRTIYYTC